MINSICVAGAGTMGSGIALCAAQHGIPVTLFDVNPLMLITAREVITTNLDFLVARQKLTATGKEEALNNIKYTSSAADCVANLVIEAIVEKLQVKIDFFKSLAAINSEDTIFASNTSSFSISTLQQNIPNPGRVAGLHFFNPAHVMKLVEVVKGEQTNRSTIDQLFQLCLDLKKHPVRCNDAPGFIVNRVARHYYLEAMYLVENNIADILSIDQAMEAIGFKLGPFKLMDLIGMDINYSVSNIVWQALGKPARLTPSPIQKQKVDAGDLGRKSGKGFYQY
jgi:3-hydroxybutyryl-CoA dehydrogenase